MQKHASPSFVALTPHRSMLEVLEPLIWLTRAMDTKKTPGLCRADTGPVEDCGVMLAKKLSNSNSELPTRPHNPRPVPRFESVAPLRLHLMLVRAPNPTPRGLAWARREGTHDYDAVRLESMLRHERLNLGLIRPQYPMFGARCRRLGRGFERPPNACADGLQPVMSQPMPVVSASQSCSAGAARL